MSPDDANDSLRPSVVNERAESKRCFRIQRAAWWMLLLVIVLGFALIRFRLRAIPLERDEGEYAYARQLMLRGIPPYQLAYNMQLPGTYAAYAVILKFLGETPTAVHLGLLLVNPATLSRGQKTRTRRSLGHQFARSQASQPVFGYVWLGNPVEGGRDSRVNAISVPDDSDQRPGLKAITDSRGSQRDY